MVLKKKYVCTVHVRIKYNRRQLVCLESRIPMCTILLGLMRTQKKEEEKNIFKVIHNKYVGFSMSNSENWFICGKKGERNAGVMADTKAVAG